MELRTLGNTGLQMPALSFGASSLGQEFRQVDVGEAQLEPLAQVILIDRQLPVDLLDRDDRERPVVGVTTPTQLTGSTLALDPLSS